MSIPNLCLRLAVFLCTLTIALCVTRLFLIPPRVEMNVATLTPPLPVVVAAPTPAQVNFKVQQVVLDHVYNKTYVQLTVERDPYAPAPEHLWVEVAFARAPNIPSEHLPFICPFKDVTNPFALGDRATLTVVYPWPMGATVADLANNVYAQVTVSTHAEGGNGEELALFNIKTSEVIPVVVEHGHQR